VNYQVGDVFSNTDIYNQRLSDCYIAMLSRFQVRANLVVPLFKGMSSGACCAFTSVQAPQWQGKSDFVRKIAVQRWLQQELFTKPRSGQKNSSA